MEQKQGCLAQGGGPLGPPSLKTAGEMKRVAEDSLREEQFAQEKAQVFAKFMQDAASGIQSAAEAGKMHTYITVPYWITVEMLSPFAQKGYKVTLYKDQKEVCISWQGGMLPP